MRWRSLDGYLRDCGGAAKGFLLKLFSNLGVQEEYEVRHEVYVMEVPPSGEVVRGRKKVREFPKACPTPPSIRLRRVLVRKGLWAVEGRNYYGGGRLFDLVLIIELKTERCSETLATTPSRSR
jgi:hypothetical protein